MKESGNIRNSWTKAIEKTVRKFCTTANRIKKDAVKSVKAANIAIGISAITIGKMKLEQLKKKLPNINISIDYTGTWKDSLQLGLGIVTTGGGLLLTLVGGGSEIASVGSSSAISIPAAAEGIGIAGSGLAISFDALRNMFDVRIQKSESSKGDGEKNAEQENNKEYKIERSILKRYFQPINNVEKNVNSFDPLVTDKYIIFPYDEGGELIDINLQQYKGIKQYLLDNYDLIVPKQVSGKNVPNSNKSNWYQFGRVQAINEFNNQEKLIVGVMSKEPMFMYDNENLVIQSGGTAGYCGIKMKPNSKYNLFFLQAYLSHPIMNDVMEKMGSDFEGGFYSRGTQVLEKLPIIDVDFDNTQEKKLYDKIVNNTRKIYDLNKTLKSKIMKKSEGEAIISLRKQIVIEIMKDITELIEMKDE